MFSGGGPVIMSVMQMRTWMHRQVCDSPSVTQLRGRARPGSRRVAPQSAIWLHSQTLVQSFAQFPCVTRPGDRGATFRGCSLRLLRSNLPRPELPFWKPALCCLCWDTWPILWTSPWLPSGGPARGVPGTCGKWPRCPPAGPPALPELAGGSQPPHTNYETGPPSRAGPEPTGTQKSNTEMLRLIEKVKERHRKPRYWWQAGCHGARDVRLRSETAVGKKGFWKSGNPDMFEAIYIIQNITTTSHSSFPFFCDFTCHIFLFSLAKLGLRKVHRLKGNIKHDSENSFTFLAHFFLFQMPVLPQKGCQKSSSLTPLACLWLYS